MTDSPDQRDAKDAARSKQARSSTRYLAVEVRTIPEAYDRMFKRQHGLCLICWKPFTSTPHVDHDRDSGFVRALFCDNCNIGCGRFFDNPAFLRRAADVMEFFKRHEKRILC